MYTPAVDLVKMCLFFGVLLFALTYICEQIKNRSLSLDPNLHCLGFSYKHAES